MYTHTYMEILKLQNIIPNGIVAKLCPPGSPKYNPPQVSFLGSPPRGGPCGWMSWGDAVVELQKSVKKRAVPLLVV